MKVYVGTYSKYNNGNLDGSWFDLSDYSSYDEFIGAISEYHSNDNNSEFMVQDNEGFKDLSSNTDIFKFIEELYQLQESSSFEIKDQSNIEALIGYINYHGLSGTDLEDVWYDYEEDFMGFYISEEKFAIQQLEDTGDLDSIPVNLRYYFDYDSYANDIFIDSYISIETSKGIAVFNMR